MNGHTRSADDGDHRSVGQVPDSKDSLDADGAGLPGVAAGNGASLDTAAETEVWVGRTHWKHYAGPLALWLCGNIVIAGFVIWLARRVEWLTPGRAFVAVVGLLVLSGLEFVVRRTVLRIIDHRYRLTTQRLFIERGILSQTIDQTELIRVDDVRIHKTFLDRVFGLGSVAVVSTDATDREITIEGIAASEEVAEAIRTRMRAMRRKSLFVEKL